jgi:hypothetical protein
LLDRARKKWGAEEVARIGEVAPGMSLKVEGA